MEEEMEQETEGKSPAVGSEVPSNAVRDLLGGKSEPITPEIAAERAASRIIQAVRERERKIESE